MKRVTNIKDSIMMPPPRSKVKSRSDTSEELRKNLIETYTNTSDNSLLQEELQRFFKEMEELESKSKKNDDEISITSSLLNSSSYYQNGTLSTFKEPKNKVERKDNKFKFSLNNFNYHYANCSDDEENIETKNSMDKLIKNISQDKSPKSSFKLLNLYKTFKKLPSPKGKREIRNFVDNILSYIIQHEFDVNLSNMKIRLQTRFNDFKNGGLMVEYFKDTLIKMQDELIARICMVSDLKKIEEGNIFFNLKAILIQCLKSEIDHILNQ